MCRRALCESSVHVDASPSPHVALRRHSEGVHFCVNPRAGEQHDHGGVCIAERLRRDFESVSPSLHFCLHRERDERQASGPLPVTPCAPQPLIRPRPRPIFGIYFFGVHIFCQYGSASEISVGNYRSAKGWVCDREKLVVASRSLNKAQKNSQ